MEKVGKVQIDYSAYSGEDPKSKWGAEDELLEIARDRAPVEFPEIIENRATFPILYNLSTIRENVVRWLPINKDMKVLEIGSECGAVTGALCEMAGTVHAIDLSKKRSLVNAYRHLECDNLTIFVGAYSEICERLDNDYDYIIVVGALDRASMHIDAENPYEDLLRSLRRRMNAGGRIVIATGNRMGMKYLAGCKEDNLNIYFKSLEGYTPEDGTKTFTRNGLKKILTNIGISDYHFYYPYPDFRFMNTIFSDKRLPVKGELTDNIRNFDNDRMLLFDETRAFDTLIEEGSFTEYANSFLIVIGPDVNVEYARFSNDRAPQYAIKTTIESPMPGEKIVKKQALFKQGYEHILSMRDYYDGLTERYKGGKLKINKCKIITENEAPVACFEYIDGVSLAELMNDCIITKDMDRFMELFDRFVELVGFGEGAGISDMDVVFSNIICDVNDWTLIDYEWTVNKDIPIRETAFRSIYCYLMEHKDLNLLNLDSIIKKLGLSDEACDDIRGDETILQKKITGKRLALGEMHGKIGYKVINPMELISKYHDDSSIYKLQVYHETPTGGFSEEQSEIIDSAFVSDAEAYIELKLSADERVVRIDPLMDSCMVTVKECTYNGNEYPVKDKRMLQVNGKRIDNDGFLFPTLDPNMVFVLEGLPKSSENIFTLKLGIVRIPVEEATKLASNIKRIF